MVWEHRNLLENQFEGKWWTICLCMLKTRNTKRSTWICTKLWLCNCVLDGLVQIGTCSIVLVLNDWKNLAYKKQKIERNRESFLQNCHNLSLYFFEKAIRSHLVAIETPLTCYGMLLLVIACTTTMRAINVYIHR